MQKISQENREADKSQSAIKATIWDNAGVLGNAKCGSFGRIWVERLEAPIEDVVRVLTGPEHALWDKGEINADEFYDFVLRDTGLPIEKKAAMESISWNDAFIDIELMDYIRELHRHYKTAILSNFPQSLLDMERAAVPWLSEIFDIQIFSCEVHLLKPDAAIYQLTLDKLNCTAAEAVFVDDSQENVDGARAVGMQAILYRNREQTIRELDSILSQD